MMAKISNGHGFAGLVGYANDAKNKQANIIASEGVDLTSNKSITASFSLQAKSRPSVKNFVGHISLSFAPEDAPKLSNKLMAEIAKEYMRRMGIVNTQYIMPRHHDKPHPHVHIVYNRVDNDGNAISGDQNFRKSVAITQALTREYGLTFGKGKKKVNRDRLKGKDVVKYRIYDAVTEALKTCRNIDALKVALTARGIGMNIISNAAGQAKGVVFSCGTISFAGYQIDRTMTYGGLCKSLGMVNSRTENATMVAEDSQTIQQDFSFGCEQSGNIQSDSVRMADGVNTVETAGGNTSAGGGIGAAMVELILQPHVVQTSSGGGGGNKDRDDEDKEKNKKNPYRRRR